MIYCREKLIDIILESPWISLEEKFDFDITLNDCMRRGLFTKSEWLDTEAFLVSNGSFTNEVRKVIVILSHILGYSDVIYLSDKPELFKSLYKSLEEGIRF